MVEILAEAASKAIESGALEKVAGEGLEKGNSLEQLGNFPQELRVSSLENVEDIDKPLNYKDFSSASEIGETKEVVECVEKKVDIITRNEGLEGQVHPQTGVPFERREVSLPNGQQIEGVFPKFESTFDAQLPQDKFEASNYEQFAEANNQLKEAVEKDPQLAEKFDAEQLEQIENGDTPDGYTWHHDAEPGKMQLVETEVHQQTGHTGGQVIWGGGGANR